MLILKFALLICLNFLSFHVAHAETFPALSGAKDTAECREAFAVAGKVFKSNAFRLDVPSTLPEGIKSKVALGPEWSLEEGVGFDAEAFERIDKIYPPLFWQLHSNSGFRLVLQLNQFGWRGNQYTLYSVPEDLQPDQFIAGYDSGRRTAAMSPVIPENWIPPLILQTGAENLWAIGGSHPAIPFPTWSIYARGAGKEMMLQCEIHFGPDEPPLKLLPPPVQKLHALLSEAVGDGRDEGTSHPTAHIAVGVQRIWAIIATRPWVLPELVPYNSREEVDRNLMQWARPVKSFYRLHQKIYTLYPTAQNSLEKYYISHFGMTAKDAKKLAAQSLDIAFRSYFVFPR